MTPWQRTAVTETPASRSFVRVRLALVAQDIGFGGDHQRGRQAGELLAGRAQG
jgi:hypothetical protein